MSTFEQLISEKRILKAVEEMGYSSPTKIQEDAIPLVNEGKDMIAKSNTGTGKTAAFGLPLLEKMCSKEYQLAIIICPTRELVQQAEVELNKFSKYIGEVKVVSVYGGAPITNQIKALKRGHNIIVGTPGRILDHIKRKTIKLKECDCVVLDEADEMLNMGFREDIEMILKKVEKEHQTILFSATMPKEIRDIANKYLKDKVEIEVKSKQKTVDKIKQYYYDVKRDEKGACVKTLLSFYDSNLSIIFCNTKAKVDELVEELNKKDIKAVGLHGDIKQEKRTKIMNAFKKSTKQVLVASDVAARGIDVNNIDLIINFDLPQDNEIYVHRIGRTGRAGKEGRAVTLVQSGKQFKQLKGIMKYTNANIERRELPTYAEVQQHKAKSFKEIVLNKASNGLVDGNIQLANELIKEGLDPQELISALISIAFGDNNSTETKPVPRKKVKDGVELKFTLGKGMNISRKDIEDAILARCELSESDLGHIDVRKQYSIVAVTKSKAGKVLEVMHNSKINDKQCEVYSYKKEKSTDRRQRTSR